MRFEYANQRVTLLNMEKNKKNSYKMPKLVTHVLIVNAAQIILLYSNSWLIDMNFAICPQIQLYGYARGSARNLFTLTLSTPRYIRVDASSH